MMTEVVENSPSGISTDEEFVELVRKTCEGVAVTAWQCHEAAGEIEGALRDKGQMAGYFRGDVVAALAILTAKGHVAWERPN